MKISSLIIILMSFISALGYSQEFERIGKISSSYDRNSLATFYLHFNGESNASLVKDHITDMKFNEKFDNNNLSNITINSQFPRSQMAGNDAQMIKNQLNQLNIGKQIVSRWFNRQDNGVMDMELVFSRGMFNATDAAYIKAQSTKKGNALLEDYGERLIRHSYVLILDYYEVKNVKEADSKAENHGWTGKVKGYLFRVNFDEDTRNKIYDCWIYDTDTPEIIAEKNRKYEALIVDMIYVTSVYQPISASQANPSTTLGKYIVQKSDNELMSDLVQTGYNDCIYNLECQVEDFMVKTTIASTRPLRAKIGLKEGVRCDHRYFAYEYVYNQKTNVTAPKRRGVVRATSKIADNRYVAKGDMATTKFYQTAGGRLEEGFLLRQQNDLGLEFWATGEFGNVGGANIRLDYRLGSIIGIRAFFFYADLGFDVGDYNGSQGALENVSFLRYSFGIGKGLQLMRNLELRPYIGVGNERASGTDIKNLLGNDSDNEKLESLFMKLGANLALNLTHNIQFIAGLGYYTFVGDATYEKDAKYGEWDKIFPDRSGVSPMLGAKIMF